MPAVTGLTVSVSQRCLLPRGPSPVGPLAPLKTARGRGTPGMTATTSCDVTAVVALPLCHHPLRTSQSRAPCVLRAQSTRRQGHQGTPPAFPHLSPPHTHTGCKEHGRLRGPSGGSPRLPAAVLCESVPPWTVSRLEFGTALCPRASRCLRCTGTRRIFVESTNQPAQEPVSQRQLHRLRGLAVEQFKFNDSVNLDSCCYLPEPLFSRRAVGTVRASVSKAVMRRHQATHV